MGPFSAVPAYYFRTLLQYCRCHRYEQVYFFTRKSWITKRRINVAERYGSAGGVRVKRFSVKIRLSKRVGVSVGP